MPRHWLFKTEPGDYSFADLEREGKTVWNGVSNNLALRHLREVRMGDDVLVYHTGDEKAIVGLAQAIGDPFADPRDDDEKLVVVEIKPIRPLSIPLTLAELKAVHALRDFDLVRLPRLSVMPVPNEYWAILQDMMQF
jgi:predicted RNA-binding protein with PUA-like domain